MPEQLRLPTNLQLGGDWSSFTTNRELELIIASGDDARINRNFKEIYEYLDALTRELRQARIAK